MQYIVIVKVVEAIVEYRLAKSFNPVNSEELCYEHEDPPVADNIREFTITWSVLHVMFVMLMIPAWTATKVVSTKIVTTIIAK